MRWLHGLPISFLFIVIALGAPLVAHAQTQSSMGGEGPRRLEPTAPVLVVARIYFDEEELLHSLASMFDVWEVHHSDDSTDRYIVTMIAQAQVEALRRVGLRVEVDEAKTAELYLQPLWGAQQAGGIPGYACYRTLEETNSALAQLSANHPGLATWIDIGDSWNKTNPGHGQGHDLNVLVLTNRDIPGPKPRFFLMAAIHARELATAELASRFAEELINGYGRDPDATWLLDFTEIHIAPMVNPDGRKWAEQLLFWRKNTNRNDGCPYEFPFYAYYGVDLNRNSSFKWGQCEGGGCSTDDACRDTFRGSGPASEPETQAIQNYIASIFADQRGPDDGDAAPVDATGLMISLHSYSRLVLFPWGWSAMPSPNHTQFQTLGAKFGYFNHYKVCQAGAPGCIYMTDGTTDDWAYGELGVAAYTFEVGTAFFQQCSYFEETILPDNMPALRYAAKVSRRPYQMPAGPDALQVVATPARILSGAAVSLTAQIDDTRHRTNTTAIEPVQAIAGARYTIASPSWITGVQTYSMAAVDGLFDNPVESAMATVDTTGWPAGRRLLLVEGQDTEGNWGAPSGVFVDVLDSPYGVAVATSPLSATVAAGHTLSYTLRVTNTGLVSDTFALTVLSAPWALRTPGSIGPLGPLATETLRLQIDVPLAAPVGATEIFSVAVASTADSNQAATSQFVVTVAAPTVDEGGQEPIPIRIFLPLIEHP